MKDLTGTYTILRTNHYDNSSSFVSTYVDKEEALRRKAEFEKEDDEFMSYSLVKYAGK